MRSHLLFTSMYPCKHMNKQHWTNLLQIARPLKSPATYHYTQMEQTWVECASRLSFIPFWLVAYYIFFRTFHCSLSSSSPFPQQQDMAPDTPRRGVIESESCRTTGAPVYAPLPETQQQWRHQLLHHNAAISATENMAQDAHFNIAHHTRRSNNQKQHAMGCEYLPIDVNGSTSPTMNQSGPGPSKSSPIQSA